MTVPPCAAPRPWPRQRRIRAENTVRTPTCWRRSWASRQMTICPPASCGSLKIFFAKLRVLVSSQLPSGYKVFRGLGCRKAVESPGSGGCAPATCRRSSKHHLLDELACFLSVSQADTLVPREGNGGLSRLAVSVLSRVAGSLPSKLSDPGASQSTFLRAPSISPRCPGQRFLPARCRGGHHVACRRGPLF